VKVKGALDAMNYYLTIALNFDSELMWGKMCCKGITKLKA
jgi:hypothetical protein